MPCRVSRRQPGANQVQQRAWYSVTPNACATRAPVSGNEIWPHRQPHSDRLRSTLKRPGQAGALVGQVGRPAAGLVAGPEPLPIRGQRWLGSTITLAASELAGCPWTRSERSGWSESSERPGRVLLAPLFAQSVRMLLPSVAVTRPLPLHLRGPAAVPAHCRPRRQPTPTARGHDASLNSPARRARPRRLRDARSHRTSGRQPLRTAFRSDQRCRCRRAGNVQHDQQMGSWDQRPCLSITEPLGCFSRPRTSDMVRLAQSETERVNGERQWRISPEAGPARTRRRLHRRRRHRRSR